MDSEFNPHRASENFKFIDFEILIIQLIEFLINLCELGYWALSNSLLFLKLCSGIHIVEFFDRGDAVELLLDHVSMPLEEWDDKGIDELMVIIKQVLA